MFEVAQLTFNDASWHVSKGFGVSLEFQSHISVMQFIGLLDKNGAKVFEGDILRCNYEGLFDQATVEGVVEIRSFELWLDFPSRGQSVVLKAFDEESFEVIGNEYQNPELLENAQARIQTPTEPEL